MILFVTCESINMLIQISVLKKKQNDTTYSQANKQVCSEIQKKSAKLSRADLSKKLKHKLGLLRYQIES